MSFFQNEHGPHDVYFPPDSDQIIGDGGDASCLACCSLLIPLALAAGLGIAIIGWVLRKTL